MFLAIVSGLLAVICAVSCFWALYMTMPLGATRGEIKVAIHRTGIHIIHHQGYLRKRAGTQWEFGLSRQQKYESVTEYYLMYAFTSMHIEGPQKPTWFQYRPYSKVFSNWVVNGTEVRFPLWIPMLLLGAWPMWRLAFVMRERIMREGYCLKCGYDLRGNPDSKTCPECGHAIDANKPNLFALIRYRTSCYFTRSWLSGLGVFCLAMFILSLAGLTAECLWFGAAANSTDPQRMFEPLDFPRLTAIYLTISAILSFIYARRRVRRQRGD